MCDRNIRELILWLLVCIIFAQWMLIGEEAAVCAPVHTELTREEEHEKYGIVQREKRPDYASFIQCPDAQSWQSESAEEGHCACIDDFEGLDCSYRKDCELPPPITLYDVEKVKWLTFASNAMQLWRDKIVKLVLSQRVPGDIVEVGAFKGGGAAIWARAMEKCTRKRLWLYDSFEGLPELHEELDVAESQSPVALRDNNHGTIDLCRTAIGLLSSMPEERLVFRKGWYNETFKSGEHPNLIALLHVDGDLYESVLDTLEKFYDRVAWGGIIILDDFGYWPGSRVAFYDFARKRRIMPMLGTFTGVQAYWIKGRESVIQTEFSPDEVRFELYLQHSGISAL